jgi:hypothetical protein
MAELVKLQITQNVKRTKSGGSATLEGHISTTRGVQADKQQPL